MCKSSRIHICYPTSRGGGGIHRPWLVCSAPIGTQRGHAQHGFSQAGESLAPTPAPGGWHCAGEFLQPARPRNPPHLPTLSQPILLKPHHVSPSQMYLCVLSRFSRVWLFATPWTLAHQAPLSIVFSRQEYWGGLPFPSPGDLPDPGIKPMSLKSPALAGGFFTARALQSPDNI